MFKDGLSDFLVALYLSVAAMIILMISLAVPNLQLLCKVNTFLVAIITGFVVTNFVFGIRWLLKEEDFNLRVALFAFCAVVVILPIKLVVSIVYAFDNAFVIRIINDVLSNLSNVLLAVGYSFLIAGVNDRVNGYNLEGVIKLGVVSKIFISFGVLSGIAYKVVTYFFPVSTIASVCISLFLFAYAVVSHIMLIVFVNKAITKIDKEEILLIESFS